VIGGDMPRRVIARGGVLDGSDGRRFSGAVIDITHEKETEDALRERTAALQTLNRTGETVAGELDLERVVQTVTDAGVALTGAQFGAFFYNVLDETGERYMLYALSGASREAFSKFPMPRNTALFAPTFSGEGTVRSDDITLDPRYGRNMPGRGMPQGQLSRRPRQIAQRRGAGRAVLRPFRGRPLHGARRGHHGRLGRSGRGRHRQCPAFRRRPA
jgi:hypothetical protein